MLPHHHTVYHWDRHHHSPHHHHHTLGCGDSGSDREGMGSNSLLCGGLRSIYWDKERCLLFTPVIPHGSHNHGSLSLSTPIPPPSQSPLSPSSHLHPLLAPSTQQYSSTIALPVDWLHELQNEPVPERWIHNTPSPTIKKRCKRREYASLEWGRPRTYTNVQDT